NTDSIAWSKSVSNANSMRVIDCGCSHESVSWGVASPGSATQALGAVVGRSTPLRIFSASNNLNGSETLTAIFCPWGLRCGHQNSNSSTPEPAGGRCRPLLDTFLFTPLNTDSN